MEQEIDLRPYLQALLRQWRVILGLMLAMSLLAVGWTIVVPQKAQARGDLLIIPKSSQLSLDARFTERDSSMLTSAVSQRQALIDLATSTAMEARVAKTLGLDTYKPDALAKKIKLKTASDLFQITASEVTPDEASRLAETWTKQYEALINELYNAPSGLTTQINDQLTSAQQRFDQTQNELNTFYAAGDLVRLRQQVQRIEGMLNGARDSQQSLYTAYLNRTQELNLILENARSLQAQYAAGTSTDLAAGLSSLAMRARLAGGAQLPVQLNFNSAESFAQGQAGNTDLASFISVIERERERMIGESNRLSRALATGDGTSVGLPETLRANYETELAAAKGKLAQAEGQEALLIQRRKVALASLEVLQNRLDENQIAQAAPEVTVRFVGVTALPSRSLVIQLALNVAVAAMLGMLIAMAWVIGREIWRRAMSSSTTVVVGAEA